MKAKLNIRFDYVTVWLGAVLAGSVLLGTLLYIAKKSAEKYEDRHLNDPRLADIDLKIPNFEATEMDADAIDAVLAGQNLATSMHAAGSINPAPVAEVGWSYTGASGPEFWHQLTKAYSDCSSKFQSPVDLPTSVKPDRDLQPIRFLYKELPGQVLADKAILKFKPVQGHTAILFDETFYLSYVEFHIPSEHQINGVGYDMEIQLYHRNVADQWAVVAILANESRQTHGELKKIIANLPKQSDRPSDIGDFSPARFLPDEGTYLHYTGSLTSPPCTPEVRWIVMTSPIAVSDAQIDALSKISGFTARPLQELGGRAVDKSWR